MRFMMMIYPQIDEADWGPRPEDVEAMMGYNRELTDAGVLLAVDGLHAGASGARVTFSADGEATVTDGPFAEAKELIGGYWMIDVRSRDEALEWARRIPGRDCVVEAAARAGAGGLPRGRAGTDRRAAARPPGGMTSDTHAAIDAVWRIESARLIAGLARIVRDVGLAEELAGDALVAALEQWPEQGVPDNPGAWLMATAKHRAIDLIRRQATLERKVQQLGRMEEREQQITEAQIADSLDDPIGDDLLALIFVSCHPVLPTEARVALTLRLIGALTTEEIARAFLTPTATVAQRIVRAKRTLAEARVPIELPGRDELPERLTSVLEVIYLVFNEGYAATAGDDWVRPELCEDALRLGRIVARTAAGRARGSRPGGADGDSGLAVRRPGRPRRRARPAARPGPLALGLGPDPPRARRARPRAPLGPDARPAHAPGVDRGLPCPRAPGAGHRLGADRGAVRRARASSPRRRWWSSTGRSRCRWRSGPQAGLELVDGLIARGELGGYHLLPSVRGDLLLRLGRVDEARAELERAAAMTGNERERQLLLTRARRG